ncbi:MAG: glycerate dehydrogenase, partial [Clostridia bacterium]|nr:glycerate dehydrogenase [Clostridia bacterium]
RSLTVSNHLANNAQTRGMLNYALFSQMRQNAVFINTGRGAQVVEDDLVRALMERPDLTALLDVTYPEPPVEGHPFYTLPNCLLTPHIAGSAGDEVARMGKYMLDECQTYLAGEPCKYEVSLKMLETMA